jgi:Putative DNA-binding domain
MFTFAKPLEEITEDDLRRLITDRVEENRQLEYKRELPGTGEGDKREFVRDVVSFANSAGGHIVFGIAESNGVPTELASISEDKIDDAKLRFESIIRTSIEPAIQGLKINSVKVSSGCALIIEIPRGLFGLHMIKSRRAFIARTSAGKFDLDVNEIRAAFVGAEAAVQRLSEFRADRTENILNGNALWPLCSSRVGVIHLLPLASFTSGYRCEIDKIPDQVKPILYRMGPRPSTYVPKFTFDGYAHQMGRVALRGGALLGYSHLFRNGAIENVNAGFLDQSPDTEPAVIEDAVHLYWLENLIMDCAERMLKIMELLEIPGPYYLLVAFLNVKGLRVSPEERRFIREVRTIEQQNLILPEVLLENPNISIESEMRSTFDMIWNACDWKRSLSYDEQGLHTNANWRKCLY